MFEYNIIRAKTGLIFDQDSAPQSTTLCNVYANVDRFLVHVFQQRRWAAGPNPVCDCDVREIEKVLVLNYLRRNKLITSNEMIRIVYRARSEERF